MSDEKKKKPTIFIRCSDVTNELLDKIRKAEMPNRSRNSQIIYLIHQEAKKLGLDGTDKKEEAKPEVVDVALAAVRRPAFGAPEKEVKRGLQGLVGTKRPENLP
tara:strand:+ start:3538 stop:3849 length:312 start_codon:yes stop_codon:yes gene_type:complete